MVLSNAICEAAKRGDTAAIQAWFSTGTRDLDDEDQYGYALLYFAAYNGRCETIRVLLAHGASVNATGNYGFTPLQGAVIAGKLDAAVVLLDRGAQIDLPDSNGCTPLIWASVSGHCDMIRLLLSRGADLAAHTSDGRNAEAWARHSNKDEAAAFLADVRWGGGWDPYLRAPRKRLLALRVLCERGRALTDDDLLEHVFGPTIHAPHHQGIDPAVLKELPEDARAVAIAASLRAYPAQPKMMRSVARAPLPKEVFWLILKFWRSDRDFRD